MSMGNKLWLFAAIGGFNAAVWLMGLLLHSAGYPRTGLILFAIGCCVFLITSVATPWVGH